MALAKTLSTSDLLFLVGLSEASLVKNLRTQRFNSISRSSNKAKT
jgi:hypothetical protein